MSGKASLTEIRREWSYLDLVLANEALDIEAEIEDEAAKIAAKEAKSK
jgi:hypothetical protein